MGSKIKTFMGDGGGEFINLEFNNFLKENGIERRCSAPYSPSQNGKSERKNRTILDMCRCLLSQSKLPLSLWAECINCCVYVQNRCPHRILDYKTQEVFTGEKPNVEHFRIFGCLVYFHVPKEKRNKLDASGKKGMFAGYNETSKVYRIYVSGQREVERSHVVTFDEDSTLRKVRDLPIPRKDIDDDDVGK